MRCLKYYKGWMNSSVSVPHPGTSLELIQSYWGFLDGAGAFWQAASFRPEINVKAGRYRTALLSSLLHSTLIFQNDFHQWSEPLQWNQWAHVCKSHVIFRRQHVPWLFPTPQLPLPPILFSVTSLRRVRERVDEDAPSMPECSLHLDWLWVCAPTISLCVNFLWSKWRAAQTDRCKHKYS